jgi:hypothetical protein
MAADGTRPKRGARGLGMAPAADIADERKRKLAEHDDIEAMLDEALGETWRMTYGDAARALREPYVLRVLGGKPEPATVEECDHDDVWAAIEHAMGRDFRPPPGESVAYAIGRLIEACAREAARAALEAAEPVTSIDDTTPEGILALLDAAADALAASGDYDFAVAIERTRDQAARFFRLPRRMRQWAYDSGACKPEPSKSDVERQADTLAAHGDAVLLGLLMADVADLPAVFRAALAGRGQGEDAAVKRIAATATALARKLTTKAGDF